MPYPSGPILKQSSIGNFYYAYMYVSNYNYVASWLRKFVSFSCVFSFYVYYINIVFIIIDIGGGGVVGAGNLNIDYVD